MVSEPYNSVSTLLFLTDEHAVFNIFVRKNLGFEYNNYLKV